MTTNAANTVTIPLIMIGVTRPAAVGAQPNLLDAHNTSLLVPSRSSSTTPLRSIPQYKVSAALDFSTSPAPYRYTPHNLRLLLHTLYPRPRSLILGTNYETLPVAEIEGIWEEYVEWLGREEPLIGKTLLVVVSPVPFRFDPKCLRVVDVCGPIRSRCAKGELELHKSEMC